MKRKLPTDRFIRLIALALVSFLATPAPAGENAFAFKEFTLGQPRSAVLNDPRFSTCQNVAVDDALGCISTSDNDTIAGRPIDVLILYFYADRLQKIEVYFHARNFEVVESGLIEKYGRPKSADTQRFQNAFGATFSGHLITWERRTSTLFLVEHATSRDRSVLQLLLNDTPQLARALNARRAKKAAKDL